MPTKTHSREYPAQPLQLETRETNAEQLAPMRAKGAFGLRPATGKLATMLALGAIILCANSALAQTATQTCRPGQVIPLTGTEPPAKIVVDSPLPGPLASRGVVVIPYCAENMRIASVFGPGALAVSPRVGHIHVTVDDAPWHWADASGNPLILRGLPPGPHTVLIELVDANHQSVHKSTVTFVVPPTPPAPAPSAATP